jgi:ABC-type transport system substrate-binding protein
MPPRSGSRGRRPALVLAALLAAAGCTGDEGGEEKPTGPPPAPPAAGTIVLGYPEEPPTLNPVTEPAPAAAELLRAVLPSFHILTPELTYRPSLLAEEPEVSVAGDRMTVRFRLRGDARWSDGRPITVEDVAFTWRAMTAEGVDVAHPEGFDHVVAVVERSAREGELVLSPPLASWRDLFSGGRFVLPAHAADGPADVVGWDAGPPVAGGPFELGPWLRGRSVELVANPRFFGQGPRARRIVVLFVPDPTTAIQLLEGGRLDAVAPMLGLAWSRRLARVPDAGVTSAFGPDLVAVAFETGSVSNLELRRRLAGAVDRQRFVDVVLGDEGRLAQSVVVPEQEGAIDAWARYGADLEAVEGGGELSLVYTRGELLDLVARYLHAELERVGADVELVAVETDVLWRTFVPQRRYALLLLEVRGTPFPDLSAWAGGPSFTGLEDADVARLVARVEADGPSAALGDAQDRLAELAAVLPLFQPRAAAASRGVTGVEANPTADGILWNAEEWVPAEGARAAAA